MGRAVGAGGHPGPSKGAGSRASCQSRREETWGPEAGARDKALRPGSGGESASPGGRPGGPVGRKELEAGQTLRRERGTSPQVPSTRADSGLAAPTKNAPFTLASRSLFHRREVVVNTGLHVLFEKAIASCVSGRGWEAAAARYALRRASHGCFAGPGADRESCLRCGPD